MNRSTPSRTFQKLGAGACALLLAFGASACSNGSSTKTTSGSNPKGNDGTTAPTEGLFPASIVNKAVHEGKPTRGGSLTFGTESDVLDVSPNQNVIQPSDVQMAMAVFDPLISYGDQGKFAGVPVTDNADHAYNQLADSITSENDDLTHWTLKLRKGLKFANGVPLTAQQVVDHTEWVKASPQCSCATDAKLIAEVTAVDPLTVSYTLTGPVVTFPGKLSGGLGWITENAARTAAADPMNPDILHLVGAGPFMYRSKTGDSYTVVANPNYFGVDVRNHNAKLPYLDSITFRPLADSVTRLQAVQSGGVDIMQTADTSNLVQAKKDPSLNVQPSEGSSATILVLNLTHPPFGVEAKPGESAQETAIRSLSDPNAIKARQAFNYSINRNEVNQKYYKGARVPAYGYLPRSNPWFTAEGQLPRFDAAKAKKLITGLKAAGMSTKLNAMCINTPEASGIFQILKNQGAAVGIEAKLNQVEQAVLVQNLLSGAGDIPWDTSCFRSPQLADPDGIYGALYTGGPGNLVKYSRPDVDKWLDEARQTSDRAERKKLYDQVQAQVAKDVVYIPLLFDYYGNVFRKDISGLSTPSPTSLGIIDPATLFRKAG